MNKKFLPFFVNLLMLGTTLASAGEGTVSNKRPLPAPPQKAQPSSVNANRPLPTPPKKVQKVEPTESDVGYPLIQTDSQEPKRDDSIKEETQNPDNSPKEQPKKRARANAVLVPEKDLIPIVSSADSQMLKEQNKADQEMLAQLQKKFKKLSSKIKSQIEELYKLTTSDREEYFRLKDSSKELTSEEAKNFEDIKLREEQRQKFKPELDVLNDITQYKKFIAPVDDRTLIQHIAANRTDLDKMQEAQTIEQGKIAELSNNNPEKLKFINRTGMRAIEIMNRKAHVQLANSMLKKASQDRETFRVFDFYRQLIGKTYHINSYKRVTSLDEIG